MSVVVQGDAPRTGPRRASLGDAARGRLLFDPGVLRRNFTVVGASYGIGAAAGFVTQAVLARRLGATVYGTYVAAWSAATILAMLHEFAGPAWLVREVAPAPALLDDALSTVLVLRVAAGAVVVTAGAAVAYGLGLGPGGVEVTAVVGVTLTVNALLRAMRAVLQTEERMPAAAALAVANSVLTMAVVVAVVESGLGLLAAMAGSAAVSVGLVPLTWRVMVRRVRPRLHVVRAAVLAAARRSAPFAAVTGLTVGLSYADTLVVKVLLGSAATGTYGAAARVVAVVEWLPAIVLDSGLRLLSGLAVHDRNRFAGLVGRLSNGLLVAACPVAAAGAVLGRRTLALLFGGRVAGHSPVLAVLLLGVVFAFPAWVLLEAVLLRLRPRLAGEVLAAALALNVAVDLLVARPYGLVGCAWGSVAADAVVAGAAGWALRRTGVRPLCLRPLLAAAAAAAVVWLAAYAGSRLPTILALGVTGTVYAGTLAVAWRLREVLWPAGTVAPPGTLR